jgi:hypothetical protein
MNSYQKWYQKNKDHARKYKRDMMRKLRKANPEHYRQQSRDHKRKTRDRLLKMYGEECSLCGFDDKRALTLDHVKKNGAAERLQLGERGVYRRALEQYRPEEYRTLCMNCQFIARHPAVVRLAWETLS